MKTTKLGRWIAAIFGFAVGFSLPIVAQLSNSGRANLASVTGTLGIANGGTGLTTAADDTVLVGNGTALQAKTVPSCTDTGGNHLNYDQSTNTISCGTSGAGGATTSQAKASNTARTTNATASADPDLSTTLAAGTYSLVGHVQFQAGGTGGFKAGIFASQSIATSFYTFVRIQNGSTAVNGVIAQGTPTTTITTATRIDDATGNAGVVHIEGEMIIPSSTTISLTWAQATSDAAATTVLAGSWWTFTKIL